MFNFLSHVTSSRPSSMIGRFFQLITAMDNSLLAKLPAELHIIIYQFALPPTTPVRLILSERSHRDFVLHPDTKILRPAALLRTCKEIRAQSLEIYYSSNSFQFEPDSPDDQVSRFLMAFDERLALSCKALAYSTPQSSDIGTVESSRGGRNRFSDQ